MSLYLAARTVHLGCVVVTLCGFMLRGLWMWQDSPRLQQRWLQWLPHLVDSLLLASAITLAVLLRQYPGAEGWLTAKLVALLVYIVLGSIALRRGRTRQVRGWAWLGALLTFGYIVAVAITRNPVPWVASP